MARKPRLSVSEKRLFTEFPGAWVQLPGTRTYELPIGQGIVQVRFGKNASSYLSFPMLDWQKYKSREAMFRALPGAVACRALVPTKTGGRAAFVPDWAKDALKSMIGYRVHRCLSDQARLCKNLQNINLELQGLSRG